MDKRIEKVKEAAKRDFEVIYEIISDIDFVEVRGEFCGDMRIYRYYDNGMVTER